MLGGQYIIIGATTIILFYSVGDMLLGDDTTNPEYKTPGILTINLWLALPLIYFITFLSIWMFSNSDLLGFGQWLLSSTGVDLFETRADLSSFELVAAFIVTVLMIGMMATIPAHELVHRTWDKTSLLIGRWLLALTFDTIFSIEHVYGHHKYASTVSDPATAPRGRNVYAHILISTWRGNVSAWEIEKIRLKRKKRSLFSYHNVFLRGHLMSVGLLAGVTWMGGIQSGLYFLALAAGGKALLEIVNYMEHYGLVRNPETSVKPHHSWNTNKRISSWAMFNLTRHSHHHAQGEVPYQDLKPMHDAPMMFGGYLSTILLTLIPPLWHKVMSPKVLEWDSVYASDEEKKLANDANLVSGISELVAAART
ncbi:alkane 1-monooxygenase [Veronia nyctiphanis]|nr:alkane 1-monooxygenase [Veronia nyctiphanis]